MPAQWNHVISREFWGDFSDLPSDVTQRAKRAIDRMLQDPWATELHPEKVKSAEPGVHSCRADDNYRIIWKHVKPNTIVFLLIDKHDEAYRRAARKSFVVDEGNLLRVADITEISARPPEILGGVAAPQRADQVRVGKLYIGYTDKEILAWGVPSDLLPHVRALDDANELSAFENNPILPATVFDKLLSVALDIIERPVVPDEKLQASLNRNQGGDQLYQFVDTAEFRRVLDGSMEEWMLFLAPFQRSLALRDYNGPARIRGVAGSGKTVVALHRARLLARKQIGSGKKILFLTFGSRLPGVMGYLFNRLSGDVAAPETTAFECLTVHQLCFRLLQQTGHRPTVEDQMTRGVLASAIADARNRYNLPRLFNRAQNFFQEEISYAIKGRDIQTLQQYLKLDRSGRGTALNQPERHAVFAIYETYQSELKKAGLCDYDDFILQTLHLLQSGQVGELPYAHVIVDEIQDLSEATLRLVRLLVPPGSNDLFLVGDGMQRIYPGGYALSRIGIDVTGRSSLLRQNYRNTDQILRAAHAVIQTTRMDDMEDQHAQPPAPIYSVRQGPAPILKGFVSPEAELQWIMAEIKRLQQEKAYQIGDFALLYRHIMPYKDMISRILSSQRMSLGEITKEPITYFGNQIKYTTFHSAKGLEFKVVFVVGVTDGQFVPKDDWTLEGDELEDYLEREKRLLYVAMTRARDCLYLTYSRGQPSRFLEPIPTGYLKR